MNLEESNEFVKNQNSKNKKRNIILGLIVLCIAAVLILFIIIYFLKIKDANTAKLYVNGTKVNLSKTLFINQNEVNYVSVKELASFAGYNYVKGEYKKYTEDENYCYLQSDYEVVAIEVDSNKIKKYLINVTETENSENTASIQDTAVQNTIPTFVVKSENDAMEVFELSTNVISVDGNIYVPIENIQKLFNIAISVDGKTTNIFNTFALFQKASTIATQLQYPKISGTYENVRALSDGMIVVQDNSNKYGVISMKDGSKILDMKYTDIQYVQNTSEFFVYTENSVGLLDKEGKTIIAPTKYDTLSVFDEMNKLYLAEDDGKFGILDITGNEIIPVAYDKIGLKSIELFNDFDLPETETPNVLESKYIVVMENGKFGLYDIEGNRIIKAIYTSFGFFPTQEDKKLDLNSVLIIPKEYGIYGLIIEQNGFYGIFDLELSDIVIPCSLAKIYSKTDSGELNYYMETDEEILEVKEFFLDYNNGVEEEQQEQQDSEESEIQESIEEKTEDDIADSEESESTEEENDMEEEDILVEENSNEQQVDEEISEEQTAEDEVSEEQIIEDSVSDEQ